MSPVQIRVCAPFLRQAVATLALPCHSESVLFSDFQWLALYQGELLPTGNAVSISSLGVRVAVLRKVMARMFFFTERAESNVADGGFR